MANHFEGALSPWWALVVRVLWVWGDEPAFCACAEAESSLELFWQSLVVWCPLGIVGQGAFECHALQHCFSQSWTIWAGILQKGQPAYFGEPLCICRWRSVSIKGLWRTRSSLGSLLWMLLLRAAHFPKSSCAAKLEALCGLLEASHNSCLIIL